MHSKWLVIVGSLLLGGCDSCTRSDDGPPAGGSSASVAHTFIASSTSSAGSAASTPPAPRRVAAKELTWVYEKSAAGKMHVVVSIPEHAADERLPVLVALHGRGEALKGPARGARGWVDDYWMPRAVKRLRRPPLERKDLLGLGDPARLARFNASLSERPYRGLIVVCPYTPDISSGNQPFSAAEPLTRFVVDELLPRVKRETPALGTVSATGIDGVSLGGRAALLIGLTRAEAFGVVAAEQAAFSSADAPALAGLAKQAKAKNPSLRIRLLTSLEDYYLISTRIISRKMDQAGVDNQLDVIAGPHNYDFNRGPGVYELLLFHDRALRGEAGP